MKKRIVCFGDSNTHGYCADPSDSADHGDRFNEEERYPCVLQKLLGDDFHIIEEGLSGRTSVFDDPLTEGLSALSMITPILITHEKVSLLVIMLGTNDTKERFGCSAECISAGIQRLIKKAAGTECWESGRPRILLVCPPAIRGEILNSQFAGDMGSGCVKKSRELSGHLEKAAEAMNVYYMDAAECEFNYIDYMHLTKKGHRRLAEMLLEKIKAPGIFAE